MDKKLNSLPCNILGTVFITDEGRTQTNEQETKKINVDP